MKYTNGPRLGDGKTVNEDEDESRGEDPPPPLVRSSTTLYIKGEPRKTTHNTNTFLIV